jgi:hypothetical protein
MQIIGVLFQIDGRSISDRPANKALRTYQSNVNSDKGARCEQLASYNL